MRSLALLLCCAASVCWGQEKASLGLDYRFEARLRGAARIGYQTRSTRGVVDPRYQLDVKVFMDTLFAKVRVQSARPPEVTLPGDDGDAEALEPRLGEAYLGAKLGAWTVRAGLQDLRYELRRTGEAFFLRLGESEAATDPRVAIGGGAGARVTWESEWLAQPVYVDVFWLELLESGSFQREERVVGANFDWLFAGPSKELFRTINAIAAYIDGERDAMTVGLGVDWIASRYWEAYGEVYGQFGSRGAVAGRLGARRTWFDIVSEPYIEASMWYVGEHFLSYENVDTFRILEADRVGLDIDENYWSARLKSGLSLAPILGGADVGLEARYGFFRRARSVRGSSSALGHEIDLELVWRPSTYLEVGVGGGVLLGSRFLEDSGGRSTAGQIFLEVAIKF